FNKAGFENSWPSLSASSSIGLCRRLGKAQCTKCKMRDQRTLSGQSQTCQKFDSSSIEKKLICALPTRFSNGTKPTSDRKRLSVELSRLSPIMKKCPSGTLYTSVLSPKPSSTRSSTG